MFNVEIPMKVSTINMDGVELFLMKPISPLGNELYDKIKPEVEQFGGHWRERAGGFVFAKHLLAQFNIDSEREISQFYPTSSVVAERVAELSGINNYTETAKILEPSAGRGALVDAINDANVRKTVTCVEPDLNHVVYLKEHLDIDAHATTFEEYYETHKDNTTFTHVIMNPPFSLNRTVSHVQMAYNMLEVGGTLVAIISENTLYYKHNTEFVKWLEEHDYYVEPIEFGAFIGVGTTVDTVIIKLTKKNDVVCALASN